MQVKSNAKVQRPPKNGEVQHDYEEEHWQAYDADEWEAARWNEYWEENWDEEIGMRTTKHGRKNHPTTYHIHRNGKLHPHTHQSENQHDHQAFQAHHQQPHQHQQTLNHNDDGSVQPRRKIQTRMMSN